MVSVLVYDRELLDYLAGPEKLDIGLASSLIEEVGSVPWYLSLRLGSVSRSAGYRRIQGGVRGTRGGH